MHYADMSQSERVAVVALVLAEASLPRAATDEQVETYRQLSEQRHRERRAACMVAEAFGGYDGG